MKIQYYNTPEPQLVSGVMDEKPDFISYVPDFDLMAGFAEKYQHKQNLLIIGHGGSINSFKAIYNALKASVTKQVFFLNTIDPDRITAIKKQITKQDTLVVAISKSGQTTTQLEALMQFIDFDILIISQALSPLAVIAEQKQADFIIHPPIGGRFAGLSEVALMPALLCGFDVVELYRGAKKLWAIFDERNLAYDTASVIWQLEQKNRTEIFLPIYTHSLFGFADLLVQLCHETYSKNGLGQTFIPSQAPEFHHHTNQRLFGGRQNSIAWLISAGSYQSSLVNNIPADLGDVNLGDYPLGVLSGISLAQSLQFEHDGMLERAKVVNLPAIDMLINEVNAVSVGELLAFWQMFVIYSAKLRGLDPFDQPEVVMSKQISQTKRLQAKGLL